MESWLNLSWITLETLAVVLAFGYLAFAIQKTAYAGTLFFLAQQFMCGFSLMPGYTWCPC